MIDYVPARYLVESKSLKLYLNSFRNHGAFHEDCTVAIGKKLNSALKPKWLRIGGWYPRGGMPIDVFWRLAGCERHLGARPGPRTITAGVVELYSTIACGRKRELFLVMGLKSSRTDKPQGAPAANREPSTV